MEGRGRWGADKPCEQVWPQRLELHSLQRALAAHWQVLSPPLGQQTQTQLEEVLHFPALSRPFFSYVTHTANQHVIWSLRLSEKKIKQCMQFLKILSWSWKRFLELHFWITILMNLIIWGICCRKLEVFLSYWDRDDGVFAFLSFFVFFFFFFFLFCSYFSQWVQVFIRGGEAGDRVAGTVWEQMGENRYVFARENW